MTTTYARQRQLVGATAEWAANDLVIGSGELALERTATSEVKIKVGDGATKFSALPYVTGSATGLSAAVSTELAKYLQLAGGAMTGDLQLWPQTAGTVVLPTSAVSRQWVEANAKGTFATIPEATAVTRTDVALSPGNVGYTAISVGGTPAAGNRIVKTNPQGFVDNSFIKAVDVGGPANAGSIVKLDAGGYVPIGVMPLSVQGAMFFRGEFDPSAGTEYPSSPKRGDVWYINTPTDYTFLLGDLAGQTALQEEMMVFDGSVWHLFGLDAIINKLKGYVSKAETISKSAGTADAGKWPRLNAAGILDASMLQIPGGMTFKGTIDVTTAPTGTHQAGEFYIARANGTVSAGWGTLTGATVQKGDAIIYTGTDWDSLSSSIDTSAYILRDGSVAMTGALVLSGAPTNNLHAADKKYVDDQDAAALTAANAKYQTKVDMASYLTTTAASTTYYTQAAAATAAATYQLKTGMSLYYTIAAADTKFQTKADAATATTALGTTYETQTHAASTYQTIAGMTSYETATAAAAKYETQTHASTTYLSKTDAAGLYETLTDAAKHALQTDLDALALRVTALETLLKSVTRTGANFHFPGEVAAAANVCAFKP